MDIIFHHFLCSIFSFLPIKNLKIHVKNRKNPGIEPTDLMWTDITFWFSWNAVISRWAEIETIVRDAMLNNPDNNPDAEQIKNWRTFTGLGTRLVHLVWRCLTWLTKKSIYSRNVKFMLNNYAGNNADEFIWNNIKCNLY